MDRDYWMKNVIGFRNPKLGDRIAGLLWLSMLAACLDPQHGPNLLVILLLSPVIFVGLALLLDSPGRHQISGGLAAVLLLIFAFIAVAFPPQNKEPDEWSLGIVYFFAVPAFNAVYAAYRLLKRPTPGAQPTPSDPRPKVVSK